jgi:hypothetical protein
MVLHVAGDDDEAEAGTDADVKRQSDHSGRRESDAEHPASSTLHEGLLSDGATVPSV